MFIEKRFCKLLCLSLSMLLVGVCLCSCSSDVTTSESDSTAIPANTSGENNDNSFGQSDTGLLSENQNDGSTTTTSSSLSPSSSVGETNTSTPDTTTTMKTPCIVTTKYTTDDVVVADVIATDSTYGADNTGKTDSTSAIQKAIDTCYSNGGGTVYLPAGTYLVSSGITIKAFVTLRGDWQDPDKGTSYGTIISANVKSTTSDLPALFTIMGSAGVMGLTIYYPNQNIDNVLPYGYTFYVPGTGDGYMLQSIVNCTVINGYKGIAACISGSNAHEMMTIDTLKGTFLNCGATVYNQADVGTWENLTLSNKYWAEAGSGLKNATRSKIDTYTRANSIGLVLGDLEWTQFANVNISDYKCGIKIVKGKRIEFAGSMYDITIKSCDVGLQVDSIDTRWGMLIAKSNIAGSVNSVVNNTSGAIKMAGTTLSGSTSGQYITSDATSLSGYTVDYPSSYTKPKSKLYVVSADKTGASDVTAAIQKVLDSASSTGGVVYLPAGKYRLNGALTVPAGVELRGASSVATRDQSGSSKGTIILADYGLNASNPDTATALITLKAKAGVNGIRFIYPENSCVRTNALGTVQTCSYTIRGSGSGVYAVNVAIANSYNGIDFFGCDNHYIKKLVSCCYNNTINAGNCSGGVIKGCLQNGTVITRNGLNLANSLNESTQLFKYLFDAITRVKTIYIKLTNAKSETIYNCFSYGIKTFLDNTGSTNLLVFNIGADNIGGTMIITKSGSATIINMMRYNGSSYSNSGTSLKMFNRLTIQNKNEGTVK